MNKSQIRILFSDKTVNYIYKPNTWTILFSVKSLIEALKQYFPWIFTIKYE